MPDQMMPAAVGLPITLTVNGEQHERVGWGMATGIWEAVMTPLGVKGLGAIGIVGTAAAIANAVFHATGQRIRDLPITIDRVLDPAHAMDGT